VTENLLELPLYASKPRRTVPGTDVVAVTMYRSTDNSVREFALITKDGQAYLGAVKYHGPKPWRPAGYTMVNDNRGVQERWNTLADYVAEMKSRLGIEVSA